MDASAEVRQEAYGWLLNGNTRAQNTRIRIILEQDAFDRLYDNWREVGFPFGHLCPRSAPRSAPPATGRRRWPS